MSAARGAYASEAPFEGTAVRAGELDQTAFGADAEYSRDYWLVRAEALWSRWDLPEPITSPRPDPAGARRMCILLHMAGFRRSGPSTAIRL